MTDVRVAINGFGRIGRLAFRQMFVADGYEVVAINDLTDPKMLANLLKYDSAQGKWTGHTIEAGEDNIVVDGKKITIYKEPDANKLPWGKLDVDVVLECTGFYTKKDKAMAHINAGAKKVVISAPAGNDLPTIVFSVNEKTLKPEDKIISAASCTTNCLAPMANTLNKYAPIKSGIMTTVHAYTGDQMILDGPHRKGDLRRARAGAINIVPNSTGAAKAIGLVIPELQGKLIGSAQRVPVPTGSTTILVAVVEGKDVTVDGINAAMINDSKCDVIWGVAGNAGNGAAEAILDSGKGWFIGVDSDQELTLNSDLAAITLTSGLKNVGASLVWFFDELDAGTEHYGERVSLGIKENGVGIVTDKNYDKYASADTKAKVQAVIDGITAGTIKVDSAFDEGGNEACQKLRDSVQPSAK